MAANALPVSFRKRTAYHLQRWVEENPGRVNITDNQGYTPLYPAVYSLFNLPLVLWLLDEKGADVNMKTTGGNTILHVSFNRYITSAALDRGANPTELNDYGETPFMRQASIAAYPTFGTADIVVRMLQDPRFIATIDYQDNCGRTALHRACANVNETRTSTMVDMLLKAGANPSLTTDSGTTPLAYVRHHHPTYNGTIALLQSAEGAMKASLLVKARRLFVISTSSAVAPSYLQGRVERGKPLPGVTLLPVMDGNERARERHRKLRDLMAFVLGVGGGSEGESMPRDVFRVTLNLLMPLGDPLRLGIVGDGGEAQSGYKWQAARRKNTVRCAEKAVAAVAAVAETPAGPPPLEAVANAVLLAAPVAATAAIRAPRKVGK